MNYDVKKINRIAERLAHSEGDLQNILFKEMMELLKVPIDCTVNGYAKYKNATVDRDDLMQVAQQSIFEASRTWECDGNASNSFLSYAMRSVKLNLIHLTVEDSLIRIPYSSQLHKVKKNGARFSKPAVSSTEEFEETYKKVVPAHQPDPLNVVLIAEDRDILNQAINNLNERDRALILGRYAEEKSLVEMAEEFNCTKQNIYSILKTAISHLADNLKCVGFEPDMLLEEAR